jgi:hypothetical protein
MPRLGRGSDEDNRPGVEDYVVLKAGGVIDWVIAVGKHFKMLVEKLATEEVTATGVLDKMLAEELATDGATAVGTGTDWPSVPKRVVNVVSVVVMLLTNAVLKVVKPFRVAVYITGSKRIAVSVVKCVESGVLSAMFALLEPATGLAEGTAIVLAEEVATAEPEKAAGEWSAGAVTMTSTSLVVKLVARNGAGVKNWS